MFDQYFISFLKCQVLDIFFFILLLMIFVSTFFF